MNAIANAHPPESPADLLALQRAAFRRDGAPSLADRRSDLSRLRATLIANRSKIETAINADFGHRSRHETSIMELAGLIGGIDYLHSRLPRMMRPEKRHVAIHMRAGSARVEYQPLGVVGVMAPWNYPVVLALMPLVTAIAAGNRVMLKPSEFTPKINAVLEEILGTVFPIDQVAVVNGDASVGATFSALPFDHLIFTGSTPDSRVRHHYVRAAVKVRQYPDGRLAIFHGPRRIGRYDAQGREIGEPIAPMLPPCSTPSRRGLETPRPTPPSARRPALTASRHGAGAAPDRAPTPISAEPGLP
ncbi:aldehyde dehydrogenase family protein [Mesorhizobium sp. L-8-3]|uniref:aldehyde dehydrogenase family protein n=1 Tax=Mesorhizobium sp. L-8-3 TaxID=2744522 RepID=UPI001928BC33|nr:aldehyde dehydrogenase family protein [Mesorhizobium sp. L-8-3]BCH25261.1 hypothetical protein MesoLjLb_50460 [Mesorhizobium sp. L-8-3]